MPVLFIGHGAPLLAIDPERGAPLRRLGKQLPRPEAILAVSAHWEETPVQVGTTRTLPLIYDFHDFPEELGRVGYPAPGAPKLADRVEGLLGISDVVRDETRGLDHGVWTPLVHVFPEADVPVLQISLPSQLDDEDLFALGARLGTLREEGILLVGSGNLTHNMREMRPDGTEPEPWALEFDAWVATVLRDRDWSQLIDAPHKGPSFARNHPTREHWQPILVIAGAASIDPSPAAFPVHGFEHGNLCRRSVLFG